MVENERPVSILNFTGRTDLELSRVSQSAVGEVREYIRSQSEHHKRLSFQDEFRVFLQRYEIGYDERYVWD